MNIKNIAVLGTGTMGSTIALISLVSGFKATVYGRKDESIEKCKTFIINELKKINNEKLIKNITFIKKIEDLKDIDFVIEALAENLELKQRVFSELDDLLPKNIIFSSNTSGLSPTDISKLMKNKERLVIGHFWNPAHLIPLVEIVPSKYSSENAMEITIELMRKLNKEPVRMEKECLGFIGNRLQLAMLREAMYIVEQGYATIENVDKAMEYSLGRRLPVTGPLKSCDLGGLDVFNNVSKYLFADLCDYKEGSEMLNTYVKEGKLGSKSGEGFYKWTEENKERISKERNEVLQYFLEK